MNTSRKWTAGDRVIVRASRCRVTSVERWSDCAALTLSPQQPPDTPFGTLLVPFDRPRPVDIGTGVRAVRPRRWLHTLRRAAAQHHPFGSLRESARARVDLLPYQLEPALAMLRHGHLRVLLADAVGLGKTIQAGFVLAEVLAADPSRRALAMVPAGLRQQWRSELASHFSIDAALCDAAWLRQRERDLPVGTNPWSLPGAYLVSLDFIRQPEVCAPLRELLWDLVIVDEAHLVTLGTDRRHAVDALAARSRRVLLLTATPHAGDEAQFDALCAIGQGHARTPLVVFRRRRGDLGPRVARRSALLRVQLSPAERRMHELLDRYTSRLWREAGARGDRVARLVPIVLRKRALSSAGSLVASLARRMHLLTAVAREDAQQLALPIDARDDAVDDGVGDEVLGAPGLTNTALERRWLAAILEVARRATADERKIARLCRYLSAVRQPAIVFTEYRDTLIRLERALASQGLPVLTLHGGMSSAERGDVHRSFNARDSLLLATDAAAEGLNLQHRCRLVIHFELPWNPLRLEQRAGRVDRIGQTRRVHEVALVADHTSERIVLAPLARRARRVLDVAPAEGRMLELLSEARVAETIFAGGQADKADGPQVAISPPPPLASESAIEAVRLTNVRRWLSSEGGPRRRIGRPVVTTLGRCGSRAPDLTVVYSLSLVADDGTALHRELLVMAFSDSLRAAPVRAAADATHLVRNVMDDHQLTAEALVGAHLAAVADAVGPLHRTLIAALRAREMAIGELQSSPARVPVQAGLFDRRALREADAQHEVEQQRRSEAESRLRALPSPESLTPRVTFEAALIRGGTHA